jgi:phosphatidylglycerophosphatase A
MIARGVSSAGGVGFCPVAPGTAGSVVALGFGAWAMLGPWWLLPGLAALAVIAGLVAVPLAVVDKGADPGWVVIDEVAGQWIAMCGLAAATPLGLLGAFVLFRALDIWKPGPVGWADRRHGAVGIMLDDVIAGAIAGLLLFGARWMGVGGLG